MISSQSDMDFETFAEGCNNDDDSDWIPLTDEESDDSLKKDETQNFQTSFQLDSAMKKNIKIKSSPPSFSSSTNVSFREKEESIETIQARLENRIKLREGLVNHPLHSFGKIFWKHLVYHLWTDNKRIRLGLIFVFIGLFLHILRSISQMKVLLYVSLLLLGVGYLFRWDKYFSSTSLDLDLIHNVTDDIRSFRFVFLCFLFIPTFIEVQTYIFFVRTIIYQSRSKKFMLFIIVLLIQSCFLYHLKAKMKLSSVKCNRYGRIMLQSLAFLFSIHDWRNLHLGGPFFILLGGYLLTSVCEDENGYEIDEMEWANRIIRLCLRLTLRDVLSDLGENVADNEMLQLAMLRWIVDYWAYKKKDAPTKRAHSSSASSTSPNSKVHNANYSLPSNQTSMNNKESNINKNTTKDEPISSVKEKETFTPSSLSVSTGHVQELLAPDLNWEDLFQMLCTTAGLMESEVNSNGIDNQFTPRNTTRSNHSTRDASDGPVDNLRSLLSSIDVDNRAKPAIQAYKLAIQSFPPTNQVCEALALLKKCPASIAAVLLQSYGGEQLLLESFLLIPSIYIEVMRVLAWRESIVQLYCHRNGGSDDNPNPSSNLYGMTLLLTAHSDHPHLIIPNRPPTLLQVWQNISNSVSVFEQGLQGVKCAQTSIVAKEFCDNVVSLAELSVQVYNKGWVYGLGVITQDILSSENNIRDKNGSIDLLKGRYTKDILGVMNNGSLVIKNIYELVEHENGLFHPVLQSGLDVFGKGWIWGKADSEEKKTENAPVGSTSHAKNAKEENISIVLQNAIHETITLNKTVRDDDKSDLVYNCLINDDDKSSPELNADKDEISVLNDAIKQTLKLSKITKENIQEKSIVEEDKIQLVEDDTEDSLASLLELLSHTLEEGLITEGEKDQIMEVILDSKTSKDTNEKHVLKTVRKSLQYSLENGQPEVSITDNNKDDCYVTQNTREDNNVMMEKETLNNIAKPYIDDMNDASGQEKSTPFTVKSLSPTKEDPADGNQKEEDEDQIDDDKSWTNITSDSVMLEGAQLANSHETKSQSSELTKNQQGNNDNLLQIVGGGLTVLGALVGGLAIMANNNTGKSESEHRRNENHSSSVIIEELEED